MAAIHVTVFDELGTVSEEELYRPAIKKRDLLSTLRQSSGPGRLKDSEGYDVESSDDVVAAGVYRYIRAQDSNLFHSTDLANISKLMNDQLKRVCDVVNMTHGMFLRCQFPPTGSSAQSGHYRQRAISRYIGSAKRSGNMFCSATGRWFPESGVVAGHIYMKKWPANYLEEIFGLRVHAPENILFLLDSIEKRFDSFELCVIPEGGDDFRIKVLNPDLHSTTIRSDMELTFGDLHDKLLSFATTARPAKRLCGFRARLALKHSEGKGWTKQGTVVVPDEALAPPTFDRRLLARFLHDVNPEDGLDGSGGGPEGDVEFAFQGALEGDHTPSEADFSRSSSWNTST